MTDIRVDQTVIAQSATSLSADDAGWSFLPFVRMKSASEGAGQIAGQAILEQQFGLTTYPNQPDPLLAIGTAPNVGTPGPDDSLVGQLVRLLVSDPDGTVIVGDDNWTPFWYGVVTGFSILPDGRDDGDAGGIATWTCAGLEYVLDQITICGGWTVPQSEDTVDFVDPGYCPPFNATAYGDRSTSQVTINGVSCYIHDLTTLTFVNKWRAIDVLTLLLAGAAQSTYAGMDPAGFPWAVSDPLNILAYVIEKTDVNGRSLAECVNQICNPRRGITWTISVVNGVAVINVWSGTDTAITVGDFTLPASTTTVFYEAAGNPWTADLSITEDQSTTYDIIEVRGARPWVGITLWYSSAGGGSLTNAWDVANQPKWLAAKGAAAYEDVWRIFTIDPDWDGSQYNEPAYGMRNSLTTDGPGGGYDGDREVDTDDDANPNASMYGMERDLPCGVVFDYGSRFGPRQTPIIVAGDGTAGNWTDYSNVGDQGSGTASSWGAACTADPPCVRIDDANSGNDIYGVVDSGSLLVSVGMRETEPLRVSYIFDQGTWPRSTPRIKMISIPELEQWVVLPETVTGVDDSGNLTTSGSSIQTIRDDTALAQQSLALAVSRYGYPIVNARFTERSVLDITTADDGGLAPGALLSSVSLGTGDCYVGSVITRRSWSRVVRDGVDQWDTSYETTRVLPDVEVVW